MSEIVPLDLIWRTQFERQIVLLRDTRRKLGVSLDGLNSQNHPFTVNPAHSEWWQFVLGNSLREQIDRIDELLAEIFSDIDNAIRNGCADRQKLSNRSEAVFRILLFVDGIFRLGPRRSPDEVVSFEDYAIAGINNVIDKYRKLTYPI